MICLKSEVPEEFSEEPFPSRYLESMHVPSLCLRPCARYIQTWIEHVVDFLKHDCTETCAAGVDLNEKLHLD